LATESGLADDRWCRWGYGAAAGPAAAESLAGEALPGGGTAAEFAEWADGVWRRAR